MLYPLIVKNFQPAFLISEFPYKIYFSFSSFQEIDQIKHIQIRIAYQNNNIVLGNTLKYPDGIVYKPFNKEKDNDQYYISIEKTDLIQAWQENVYYKVQLRCGTEELWDSNFSEWYQNSVRNNLFSEWSTTMTLKSISQPSIQIKNNQPIVYSLNPIFYGEYNSNGESADKYKFILFSESNEILEDSSWLQHNRQQDNNSNNSGNSFQFKTLLKDKTIYKVKYYVQTKNYYQAESEYYIFQTSAYSDQNIEYISLECIENEKDGSIVNILKIDEEHILDSNGIYYISRSSEKDNFSTIQDIYLVKLNNINQTKITIFSDRTIEYGIGYKYYLFKYDTETQQKISCSFLDKIYRVFFESTFLMANNEQITLDVNTTISSFKKNVLITKQDTIGGKYPIFQKNGSTFYTEFTLQALITAHSEGLISDTNLNKANLFIEKQYRQNIENFLMNDSLKLFRSPTEGNFIVFLMNVNFTPEQTLNRFLYNFSTSAYEVKDFNLENIFNENIQVKEGEFNAL